MSAVGLFTFKFFLDFRPLNKFLSRSIVNIAMDKPVETGMTKKLKEAFSPDHLEVINESSRHGVPKGSETHFKVVVVSTQFEDVGLLQRHRMVNKILEEEINGPVHALSIAAKSPKEWEESDKNIEPSPNCRGGFGK